MTKTLKSVLLLLGLVVFAHAADDFNSGVIPDQHYLSWGDRSVMIYGDAQTGNEYFRVKTGDSDRITVNNTRPGCGTAN